MAEISEYKGNALITLNPGEKYPFSFGLSKARMILLSLDAIQIFVDSEGRNCEKEKSIEDIIDKEIEVNTNLPF